MAGYQKTSTAQWVSATALMCEAAVAALALSIALTPHETTNAMSGQFGVILIVPLALVPAFLFCYVLSLAVVLPTLALTTRLAARTPGRPDAWWRIPATASAVAALAPPIAAVCGAGAWAVLWSWPATAAGITAAAVPAHLARSDRWRGRAPQLVRRVIACGGAALAVTLVAAGSFTASSPEPPRMTRTTMAGTWSDGHGGTLTLAPGGAATAVSLAWFDDLDGSRKGTCGGTGGWLFTPADDPREQELRVEVDNCPALNVPYYVLGTSGRPAVYTYRGDPDGGDLYVLRKRP